LRRGYHIGCKVLQQTAGRVLTSPAQPHGPQPRLTWRHCLCCCSAGYNQHNLKTLGTQHAGE